MLACRNPNSLEQAMNILFEAGYAHIGIDNIQSFNRNKLDSRRQHKPNTQKNRHVIHNVHNHIRRILHNIREIFHNDCKTNNNLLMTSEQIFFEHFKDSTDTLNNHIGIYIIKTHIIHLAFQANKTLDIYRILWT